MLQLEEISLDLKTRYESFAEFEKLSFCVSPISLCPGDAWRSDMAK